MKENFVEEVLRAISKEAGKKAGVDSISQLVETDRDIFQALFFFQRNGVWKVVKCRGKVKIFKDIQSILRFKRNLKNRFRRDCRNQNLLWYSKQA